MTETKTISGAGHEHGSAECVCDAAERTVFAVRRFQLDVRRQRRLRGWPIRDADALDEAAAAEFVGQYALGLALIYR